MQKPESLTTSGRELYQFTIGLFIRGLTPAQGGQFTPAECGQVIQRMQVDCHSFSDIPFNRDLNKDIPRPDFCLGADEYHTPVELYLPVQELLTKLGYTVLINSPYSGTMIPLKYYQRHKNVKGLMIEVNRKLYTTNLNGVVSKTPSFETIRDLIKNLFQVLENS